MLRLDDFFHLPQLDPLIAQLLADRHGVVVVAGLDAQVAGATHNSGVLPSGRTALFRALVGEMLQAAPRAPAALVAEERDAVRLPSTQYRHVTRLLVQPPKTYAQQVDQAIRRQPDLLVIDQLHAASVPAAFAAGRRGLRVVSQLDSVCRGADIARHLRDLGAPADQLDCLRWAISIQRIASLCPHCRRPVPPDDPRIARLRHELRYNHHRYLLPTPAPSEADQAPTFFTAPGCAECGWTGRMGDVAAFDIYRAPEDWDDVETASRGLPLETYIWHLATQGILSLDDLLFHDADQLYHTYRLLSASQQSLSDANTTLQRNLIELEAANQVLQQRTAALVSLYDLSQALIQSTNLADMLGRVCRYAREVCDADRVILYLLRSDQFAEVLAVSGWDTNLVHQQADATLVVCEGSAPLRFDGWPPGVPGQHPDVAGFSLRAGLRVPLIADSRQVGTMIVQSTRKARFAPSEVALLQSLANQAALSIQRAELIEARVRQERLERDLELARQVQQSVLPRVFPAVSGYAFAARNLPARRVGGDLYDVFALDEGHIGIVIADVSDKGMPAALYMALTRSLLLAEARRERSPRAVLLSVNRLLRELGDPHMFVTVFYGTIALAGRQLTYARAGHDYPLILRDGDAIVLGGTGTVLGCFDDIALSEEQIALEKGDLLALYTDGLTDVLAPDGRRLELERLKGIFQSHTARPPEAFCAATFADLAAYQRDAEQFDDMTLLVVGVGK